MAFTVATAPGGAGRPNEDFAGALGHCAVLLDGSGGPLSLPTGCHHGVPWFVRQLGAACLAGMVSAPPRVRLEGILAKAIAGVMMQHLDTCDLSVPGTPSSMVVMLRLEGGQCDYLVLGDSALLIREAGKPVTLVTDHRMDAVAPPEFREMLTLPAGSAERETVRTEFVRRQQLLRNAPDGYPVASTDPGAAFRAITGSVPLAGVRQVALVSDGVTRFEGLGLGPWKRMLDVLSETGPESLFGIIRRAENADPGCERLRRAKKHDDVACVHWTAPPPCIPGASLPRQVPAAPAQ